MLADGTLRTSDEDSRSLPIGADENGDIIMNFLRNTWYVAAWSKDIGRDPVAKRYLDEPVMLFRKESGEIAALADRCPHRFAPLSSGCLKGDIIQCGYHGLEFNTQGECVHNPHGDQKIPRAAKVRVYPVVDRHAMVWIWMGDPALANPSDIPDDIAFLGDESRATIGGGMIMNAHYELLTDNLMDLSHGQFVHASFMKDAQFVKGTNKVLQDGNRVFSNQWVPNGHLHGMYGGGSSEARYDQWWDISWTPPGVMVLDSGVTEAGEPREKGRRNLSGHMVTPETATTTHYFYSNSRDYDVDNEEMNEAVRHWQNIGFHEQDHPMIESVQRNMSSPDLLSLGPILLAPDAGAIRVRRVMAGLIAAEVQAAQSLKDDE